MCHTLAAKELTWPLLSPDEFTLALQGWHKRTQTHIDCALDHLFLVYLLHEHQPGGFEGEGKNRGMSASTYSYSLYPTRLLLVCVSSREGDRESVIFS